VAAPGDPPAPGRDATSAIILPVGAAEPLVGDWRRLHDESAAAGVPAHVTVVAPFLPPDRLTPGVIAELRALCSARHAPQVRFRRVRRFPPLDGAAGVVYLDPEPADGLRALTEAVVARWPEAPPYGGIHDAIVPHLTVAIADDPTLDAVERSLTGALGDGFTTTLAQAVIYVHAGDRWRPEASLPFAATG